MPVLAAPVLPLVSARLFRRSSDLHGAAHVNRVICLGQMLGMMMEEDLRQPGWFTPFSRPLWAATYLHDLARRHECVCYEHGRWAVEERLAALTPFFLEHGVRESDIPAIATAVENHSIPTEIPAGHPHGTLTALLKDADALDRCRLDRDEWVNPWLLRFSASLKLIVPASELFAAMQQSPALEHDLPGMWRVLREAVDS